MRSIDRTPGQLVVEPTHKHGSFLMRYAALWLVPLSVVVALVLVEGVLRLFPALLPAEAQVSRLWQLQTTPASIADPYLGYVYPPHYKTEMSSLDFLFTVESDEHGFRNASPWPEEAEIVVVGDSMAYGYGLEEHEAWTTLLDEALPRSRVITLGVPGTAPQQYARYLEKFGVALHPKVVIFCLFPGNDILEAEIFDRWVAAGSPGNYGIWRHFEGRVPGLKSSLLGHSLLLLSLRSVRKNLLYGMESRTIDLADGGRLQLAPALYGKSLQQNDPSSPGFQSTVEATADARDRATAIGGKFVVLFFPTKESVYLPLQGVPFSGLVHPLQEVLQDQAGISGIDLTGPFKEWASEQRQLYFEIDGHPNALGNRVVADVVTEYLRANAQTIGLHDWD